MNASPKLLSLIKVFEGFSSKPYLCPAGVPTIGYGTTFYLDKTKVTMQDREITEAEATSILMASLKEYEDAVNRYAQIPLTQGQFDALVDFAYNLGIGNLKTSTLLKKLNSNDLKGALTEFPKWNLAGGHVLPGLVARRKAEQELFVS